MLVPSGIAISLLHSLMGGAVEHSTPQLSSDFAPGIPSMPLVSQLEGNFVSPFLTMISILHMPQQHYYRVIRKMCSDQFSELSWHQCSASLPLCEGSPPLTQTTSDVESVSIAWRECKNMLQSLFV